MKFKNELIVITNFPSVTTLKNHILARYNIPVANIVKLGGYSNCTFKISDIQEKEYILRVSHPEKCLDQIHREEIVLSSLFEMGYKKSPMILKTIDNQSHILVKSEERIFVAQLFQYIEGEVKYKWFEACSKNDVEVIFSDLAALHLKMREIPLTTGLMPQSGESFNFECELDEKIHNHPIGGYLSANKNRFSTQAKNILNRFKDIVPDTSYSQIIHGDIHLENVLFRNNSLAAFLDFEYTKYAPLEIDVIFSAFRIGKYGKSDDKLRYDREAMILGLEIYSRANKNFSYLIEKFEKNERFWKALFCLDQAVLYLEKASKGIWVLEEGIGFLPCYNEVLDYDESGSFSS